MRSVFHKGLCAQTLECSGNNLSVSPLFLHPSISHALFRVHIQVQDNVYLNPPPTGLQNPLNLIQDLLGIAGRCPDAAGSVRADIVEHGDISHRTGQNLQTAASDDGDRFAGATAPAVDVGVAHAGEHDLSDLLGGHPLVGAVSGQADDLEFLRVVGPQRGLDDAGLDGGDADAVRRLQAGQGAHEGLDAVLGRVVQRHGEAGRLAGDAGNVHDRLWVRRAARRRGGEEVRDGQLRHADRVRQVDVEQLEPPAQRVVGRLGRARRVPEVAPGRLKDAGAGTYNVDGPKVLRGRLEHGVEVAPRGHVRHLEDGLVGGRLVSLHQLLRFRAQGEVREEHVGPILKQQTGEFEIDACWSVNQ